ncbi:hypothetical protein SCLCIDRAFT_764765 [Scleroderma citrinum Foug A]|uniref:Uncharacterized protein n=1 Tax=Scleroderma citrinum Foug A TaxID=1036808 RepID=A0A0C3E4B3_9AGAM|nr:hypothetical protein SCLCIDRAFT_764765 [Scleroderma citrinum Foug A]
MPESSKRSHLFKFPRGKDRDLATKGSSGDSSCKSQPKNRFLDAFVHGRGLLGLSRSPSRSSLIEQTADTINLQATVPDSGTSVADITLTLSQGVCYLASCSDLCDDTKPRPSMPTSQLNSVLQSTLMLFLYNFMFPSLQWKYQQTRLLRRFIMMISTILSRIPSPTRLLLLHNEFLNHRILYLILPR